ncbi:MAG: ammonium transporter [Bacteroidota bacterium]|nr:ammonium transporter [Bacteroidota bacterium]MDP4196285.1 ammonium transporter [Bacteroidota bacterium]
MKILSKLLIIFPIVLFTWTFCISTETYAQADPTGVITGTVKDVPAKKQGEPTLSEIADAIGHSRIAMNIIWTLLCAFLVMFMQTGFAMVETGFIRAKNVAHTMGMNFLVYAIGITGFWICGFAFMFGGVGSVSSLGGTPGLVHEFSLNIFGKTFGLIGGKGFFLNDSVYDVGIFALFLFQMVFMDTTATIPTGAMAERWKFSSFIFFSFFISMFVYPIFGNWVWGGGWLAQMGVNFGLGHGHVDFAGSSVVHMVGGIAALAGAIVLGPRIGKYGKDGTVNAIPGHNLPMAIIGTFILAFGWFGFNAGSTLSANDLRLTIVATNTLIASAAGALSATFYMMWRYGKPDPSMMANGMLAGLVAITAPCAFVNSLSSFVIGIVAGVLVIKAVFYIDQKLKVDDPVGAIAVHGINGLWGIIAVGIFADGTYGNGWNGVPGTVRGLLYGDPSQLVAQLIGSLVCAVFVFSTMYGFFKLSDKLFGIRVSKRDEIEGLDMPEMGVKGYDDTGIQGKEYSPMPAKEIYNTF